MDRPRSTRSDRFAPAAFLLAVALPLAAAGQSDPEGPDIEEVDFSGLATVTRDFDGSWPVPPGAEITVANGYGDIRVRAWNDAVVRLTAKIAVGSRDRAAAFDFAENTQIRVNRDENRLEIATVYPNADKTQPIGYSADLELLVPQDSNVVLSNYFADTSVDGVGGELAIDSRYGIVRIRDIGGLVRVRSKGEFPLIAERLRSGGVFVLRGAQATFSAVSGPLQVTNYLGSVEVRSPGANTDVDISSESGPVRLVLPDDAAPAIEARATFGRVESDFPLETRAWGDSTFARLVNGNAVQRFALHAAFDSIHIRRESNSAPVEAVAPADRPPGEPVQAAVSPATRAWRPGAEFVVESDAGDVTIEGVEGDRIIIQATKHARLSTPENARRVLEALAFDIHDVDGAFKAVVRILEDLAGLGALDYGVDILVQCPPQAPVRIYAKNGRTAVKGMAQNIVVEQGRGAVSVVQSQGALDISIESGDVDLAECAGPAAVAGGNGRITLRRLAAHAEVSHHDGNTLVDTPLGGLTIRNRGGDVRILALEGVHGDFDVKTENGHVSMVAPRDADAAFWLNAQGGEIYSAIPVTGSMERDVKSFHGKLNGGAHRVTLETRRGNIILN